MYETRNSGTPARTVDIVAPLSIADDRAAAHAGADCAGVQPAGPPLAGVQSAVRPSLVAVIDPRPLTREGLSGLLQRQERFRVVAVPGPGELIGRTRAEAADASVVLFNIGGTSARDDAVREQIVALLRSCRGIPVVLISELEGSETIGFALRLGVRGYIPTTLPGSILIEAVRLVQAGGTFVPAHAFAEALSIRRSGSEDQTARLATLTPRQHEVLDLLRRGKPNKIIAHELSMQESTVKVHVRQIMRKLQARNRTQVAFLAAQARGEPAGLQD